MTRTYTTDQLLRRVPVIPVIVIEDAEKAVPLARALFKQCRVGNHVPVELYQAVAVVLAAAYRRTGRSPGSRRVPDHRRSVSIGGTA